VILKVTASTREDPTQWDVEYRGNEKLTMPTQLPWQRLFHCPD